MVIFLVYPSMYPPLNSHAQSPPAPRQLGGAFRTGRMTALALRTSQSGDDANDDLRIEVAGGDSHEARGCGDGLLT
jgi:hypothetical protein